MMFGDFEPEDAWDPGDAVPVLIDNLFARLALLGQTRLDDAYNESERLDDVTHLLAHARLRDDLTGVDELRILLIADDIALLRARLED